MTNPKSTRNLIHLYLHIPFCRDICPYCSFYKHKPGNADMRHFVDSILREANLRSAQMSSLQVDTVYLGGGTPSMLPPDLIGNLFQKLGETFNFSPSAEINLEVNPATFGKSAARTYAQSGVTRVSLGAQSFSPDVLKTLGRTHGPREVARSFELLKAAGIENVSI
ncbi:MAG TPA: coproporphyrinogen III oxidase, partial [Verrucomicrobiales bacterium]|nr:coproporphyrinogen III oxidase [Verrucomicrobiales bacterium]